MNWYDAFLNLVILYWLIMEYFIGYFFLRYTISLTYIGIKSIQIKVQMYLKAFHCFIIWLLNDLNIRENKMRKRKRMRERERQTERNLAIMLINDVFNVFLCYFFDLWPRAIIYDCYMMKCVKDCITLIEETNMYFANANCSWKCR